MLAACFARPLCALCRPPKGYNMLLQSHDPYGPRKPLAGEARFRAAPGYHALLQPFIGAFPLARAPPLCIFLCLGAFLALEAKSFRSEDAANKPCSAPFSAHKRFFLLHMRENKNNSCTPGSKRALHKKPPKRHFNRFALCLPLPRPKKASQNQMPAFVAHTNARTHAYTHPPPTPTKN